MSDDEPTFDPTDREDRREEAARDARLHDLLDKLLLAATTRPTGFTAFDDCDGKLWQTRDTDAATFDLVRFWQEHRR